LSGRGRWGSLLAFVTTAMLAAPTSAQERAAWSYNATLTFNLLPDDPNYLQPTVRADRGRLHLESRYNYEDLESTSFFAGSNFEVGGDKVTLSLTPMFGVLVGRTGGIIPAVEWELGWRVLTFYAEAEYVIDLTEDASHYFYVWSELDVRPAEWLRAGTVIQRTRVQKEREIEPGILLGATYRKVEGTVGFFNPGSDDHYTLLLLSVSF
jgi:hypothetical protein